jgi:hypothetical protein
MNPDDHDRHSDQEERDQRLETAGGTSRPRQMTSWESDAISTAVKEQFWRQVLDFEAAPLGTDCQQLIDAGVDLPDPDTIDDEPTTSKLWEVIHGLAKLRVFLSSTDHLSDRALYVRSWRSVLREEKPILPIDPVAAWHVDLVSNGNEEDTRLYLTHYALEDRRRQWLADFPDHDMPVHEPLPYDAMPFGNSDPRRIGPFRSENPVSAGRKNVPAAACR